jgi:hypothetical protein
MAAAAEVGPVSAEGMGFEATLALDLIWSSSGMVQSSSPITHQMRSWTCWYSQ